MLTFVIQARRTPEALARVVLLLHRRRIEIRSLRAVRRRKPDVLRIVIAVEGDENEARRMESSLYKLLDVLRVERQTRRRREASRHEGGRPRS